MALFARAFARGGRLTRGGDDRLPCACDRMGTRTAPVIWDRVMTRAESLPGGNPWRYLS